jgi:hypothetical protein
MDLKPSDRHLPFMVIGGFPLPETKRDAMEGATAVVHLRGHGATSAEIQLTKYSLGSWVARILRYVFGWIAATLVTLVITFDPFVASFPFVIGLGFIYHTVRGRYHVHHFRGVCPRCGQEIEVRSGSKIPIPYGLDCFNCHHEPELRLIGRASEASVSG